MATAFVRWVFTILCSMVFAAAAYLAALDFRSSDLGDSAVLLKIVRHVILVPGILPLIFAIVWALRVRPGRKFGQGILILFGMLAFHYYLFAVSAHDDDAYPWVQAVEFVLFGFAMWHLLKPEREQPGTADLHL
jgi:hypothetical protein